MAIRSKRIGYLAASACFNKSTEVLILVPNLLKKDFSSPSSFDTGVALDCVANIMSPELASTVVSDIYGLLSSPSAPVRRKAVYALYKCFLNFPDSLRPSFARLTEHLEDDDPSVVNAVVTVMCELATYNPKTYLPLAPTFYKIMTTSTNNWMTIKIIKVCHFLSLLKLNILQFTSWKCRCSAR